MALPTAAAPAQPEKPRHAAAPMVVAAVLALLLGLQPVATDLYLPALPALARELAATPAATQHTMSILILAFGPMQLVWGPVADRIGRRPVLLVALALMALSGIGAAMSTHIVQLIGWRAAQGATLAAAVVCARAMVRDLYQPHEGARVMALALSGLGVLAIVSPLAGGALTAWFGWRATLVGLAVCAAAAWVFVWAALPETLAQRNPRALHVQELARNSRAVLTHPTFRAWALLVTATYGGLFVLLSASSFAYMQVFGFTPLQYGLAMASASLAYLLGALTCRRWIGQVGLVRAARRGGALTLAGALGMLACALLPGVGWPLLLVSQWSYMFGHGQHQPCGQAGAIGPFPHSAGLAAALAGCLLALVAFATGVALGASMDGTLRPMALGVAVWGALTVTIAWTLVQRHGTTRAP